MDTKFNMIGLFAGDLAQMVNFYREVRGVETDWDGRGPHAEFKHEGIRFAMYERLKIPSLLGQEPGYPNGLNGTLELANESTFHSHSPRNPGFRGGRPYALRERHPADDAVCSRVQHLELSPYHLAGFSRRTEELK